MSVSEIALLHKILDTHTLTDTQTHTHTHTHTDTRIHTYTEPYTSTLSGGVHSWLLVVKLVDQTYVQALPQLLLEPSFQLLPIVSQDDCYFSNHRRSTTLARYNNRLHVVIKRWLIWLIWLRASIRWVFICSRCRRALKRKLLVDSETIAPTLPSWVHSRG